MWFLPILIACPADQLGIELPAGGSASISQEDLQRDVYALTREDRGLVFARRLSQMHIDEVRNTTDAVCGRRGDGGNPRVLAANWGADVDSAVVAAALISLAKGWDREWGPPRTTWVCLAREGAALPDGERVELPMMTHVETMEAADYRVVQGRVVELFASLDKANP